MAGFYSIAPRGHRPKRKSAQIDVLVDPYGKTSKGFAERNRETQTTLPNGIVRVDTGAPTP